MTIRHHTHCKQIRIFNISQELLLLSIESLKNFRTFYLLTEICKSFRSFWTPSLKTHILWAVSLGSPFSRLSVNFFTSPEHWTNFNLGTLYPCLKGIQVCSNEGPYPFPKEKKRKRKGRANTLTKFKKNIFLQNHWVHFNQT